MPIDEKDIVWDTESIEWDSEPTQMGDRDAANDFLDKGFQFTPEENEAVTGILSPQDMEMKTYTQWLNLSTGTNHTPEMAQANLEYEYGKDATPQVANQMNKKALKWGRTKTAGAAVVETGESLIDAGAFMTEAYLKQSGIAQRMPREQYQVFENKDTGEIFEARAGVPAPFTAEEFEDWELVETIRGEEVWEELESVNFLEELSKETGELMPESWEEAQAYMRQKASAPFSGSKLDVALQFLDKGGIMLTDNLPNLLASRVNPALGMTVMFSNERNAAYDGMVEAGINPEIAEQFATSYGALSAPVEYAENLGRISSAFGVNPKRTVLRAIKAKGGEALKNVGEEMIQKLLEDLAFNEAAKLSNEQHGTNVELRNLADIEGYTETGVSSLAMTTVMEALGLSVKGAKRGAKAAMTLGDANRMRKQMSNEEIDSAVESGEFTPEMGVAVKTPTEQNVEAANQSEFEPEVSESIQEVGQPKVQEIRDPEGLIEGGVQQEEIGAEEAEVVEEDGIESTIDKAEMALGRSNVQRGMEKFMRLTTRIGSISKKARNRVRKMDFETHQNISRFNTEVSDFVGSVKEARENMSKEEIAQMNAEINNMDIEALEKRGISGIKELRKALNEIGTRIGLSEKEMMDRYFPRSVKNYEGLVESIGANPKGAFDAAIKQAEAKKGEELTPEERAKAIDSVLRQRGEGLPFKKHRTIDVVTPEMSEFYADPLETLQDFIRRASDNIAKREVFDIKQEMTDETQIDEKVVDQSISQIIDELLQEGELAGDVAGQKELADLLKSRLTMRGTGKLTQVYARAVYAKYVTNLKTAAKQFGDLSVSTGENGIENVLGATKEAEKYKEMFSNEAESFMEEIGINTIDAEFKDVKRSAIEQMIFAPLQKADVINKEILAGSTMKKWSSMSEESLSQELNELMGDQELASKVASDISKGEWNMDVAFVLYSKMSDFHPVSHSEHMKQYIDNPQIRFLGVLKSFAITRFDRLYREGIKGYITGIQKAQYGAQTGNDEMVKQGGREVAMATKGLIRFLVYTVTVEVAIDKAWDALMQKMGLRDEPETPEEEWQRSFTGMYVNELSRIFPWLDSFAIEKAWETGDAWTLIEDVVAPTKPLGFDTLETAVDYLRDSEGKKLSEFDKWKKDIPYIGREWYEKTKED